MRRLACAMLLAALAAPPGCGGRSDREARRAELADLVVQNRELELEALTRKVDPESLNLPRRIQSLERSLHDIHEKFEKSVDAFEEFNGELESEIRELRAKLEALRDIERGAYATRDEAWERYWKVTGELDRVRSLPWRSR